VERGSMEWHDPLHTANHTESITPEARYPRITADLPRRSDRADNTSAGWGPAWRKPLTPDPIQPEQLKQCAAEVLCSPRINLYRLPPTRPPAGSILSQMMTLSPRRAPLATQEDLWVTLQHFSIRAVALLHDLFFYTQA
jgi:hypothetical protein